MSANQTITSVNASYTWPVVTEETKKAVAAQLSNKICIYNRSGIIREFEDTFRTYHGREYGLTCNSGTSAIYSMLLGVGIGVDDEVIVPTYTFFATASPLLSLGAIPIFADCLPRTGNIDPAQIEAKITSRTKAVVVTHMWGIPCEMDTIVKICESRGLKLLEDCSHAHGALYKGKKVGAFGAAAAWSLGAQKLISCGHGGILLTDDEDIYVRTQLVGCFNSRCNEEIPRYHEFYKFALTGLGLNLRMHPLATAMAHQQFSHIDTWLTQKRIYANYLMQEWKNIPFLELPEFPDREPTWYAFVMQFKPEFCKVSIEEFIKMTNEAGLVEIERPGSTRPNHDLPLFTETHLLLPSLYSDKGRNSGAFPAAANFFKNAIKLPIWAFAADLKVVEFYAAGVKKIADEIKMCNS